MNKNRGPIKGKPFRRGPSRYQGRNAGPRSSRNALPEKPKPISASAAAAVKMPEGVVFYCKSCEQIVDYKPDNFAFKSPIPNCIKEKSGTGTEKIAEMKCDLAFGTERSIKHFYKIRDEKYDQERREREEKAMRADKL